MSSLKWFLAIVLKKICFWKAKNSNDIVRNQFEVPVTTRFVFISISSLKLLVGIFSLLRVKKLSDKNLKDELSNFLNQKACQLDPFIVKFDFKH